MVSRIFRHLIFGGVDSADYDIYVAGDGVYNAPGRAVEMVSVPGRNGAVALDQGRYENVTIEYPCGCFAHNQTKFARKLARFRNAILSQVGYQRLEDSFHPEEFRMGVYYAGLEVSPANYNEAGEFTLSFDCKPQRWLTAGELPVPITGEPLINPTPFNSGPLLEIEGYGEVLINGEPAVTLENSVLGNTVLHETFFASGPYDPATMSVTSQKTITLDTSLYNTGDTITIEASKFYSDFYAKNQSVQINTYNGSGSSEFYAQIVSQDDPSTLRVQIRTNGVAFTAGTSATKTYTNTASFQTSGGASLGTLSLRVNIEYICIGSNHGLVFTCQAIATSGIYPPQGANMSAGRTMVDSSLSLLGNPTYIDCEAGEAYRVSGDKMVSLNSKVYFGSDLPTLTPGANEITFDNTITDLKIRPRWWRI